MLHSKNMFTSYFKMNLALIYIYIYIYMCSGISIKENRLGSICSSRINFSHAIKTIIS